MAGYGGSNRGAMEQYRRWVVDQLARSKQSAPSRSQQQGAISRIGGFRDIGDPTDPRLTIGGVPAAVNIPGLPPPNAEMAGYGGVQLVLPGVMAAEGRLDPSSGLDATAEYMARQERLGRTRTAQLENARIAAQLGGSGGSERVIQPEITLFPAFKADPSRQGGVEWLDNRSYYNRSGAQAVNRLAAAVQERANNRFDPEKRGFLSVSRGDADEAVRRDGQILQRLASGQGPWVPTSERDQYMLARAQEAVAGINPGTIGKRKKPGAPPRQRSGRVTEADISRVLAAIEADGVVDPRMDPRYLEMEEAARDVGFPRRDEYEGDPSQIELTSGTNKTWGGIAPYGPMETLNVTPDGKLVRGNLYPMEGVGVVRTVDPDATARWDREEEPTLAQLAQEAQTDYRTPVITGFGLDQLRATGRYRDAAPSELAIYGGGGKNSLKGFIAAAGARPMAAGQLLDELSSSVARKGGSIRLSINDGGQLRDLTPEETRGVLVQVLRTARDPGNPSIIAREDGRFQANSVLPELYIQRPGGNLNRLSMAMDVNGGAGLLLREWTPIYDPGRTTTVERAIRNTLGQTKVEPQDTPLYRIGAPMNVDIDAVRNELRGVMPGVTNSAQLDRPFGVRKLLQDAARGGGFVVRTPDGTREISPAMAEAVIGNMAQLAADPEVAGITLAAAPGPSGARLVIPDGGTTLPRILLRRPDGREDDVLVSVRPGANPEPVVQIAGSAQPAFAGPAAMSPSGLVRMKAAEVDKTQDLYPFLNELRSAGFAEGAPIASRQLVTRELMADLQRKGMDVDQATAVIANAIRGSSNSATEIEDGLRALASARIEAMGGERRIAPSSPLLSMGSGLDSSARAIVELGRSLRENAPSQPRVIPEGDVRNDPAFRPKVAMRFGEDIAWNEPSTGVDDFNVQPSPRAVIRQAVFRQLEQSPVGQELLATETGRSELIQQAKQIADSAINATSATEYRRVLREPTSSGGVRMTPGAERIPGAPTERALAEALRMLNPPLY